MSEETIDYSRRNFLKVMGLGTFVFAVSRFLGRSNKPTASPPFSFRQGSSSSFTVRQQNNALVFFNADGKRIMKLAQDGELEI